MNEVGFADSMFELVDAWTESTAEEEYAALLWKLMNCVLLIDEQAFRFLLGGDLKQFENEVKQGKIRWKTGNEMRTLVEEETQIIVDEYRSRFGQQGIQSPQGSSDDRDKSVSWDINEPRLSLSSEEIIAEHAALKEPSQPPPIRSLPSLRSLESQDSFKFAPAQRATFNLVRQSSMGRTRTAPKDKNENDGKNDGKIGGKNDGKGRDKKGVMKTSSGARRMLGRDLMNYMITKEQLVPVEYMKDAKERMALTPHGVTSHCSAVQRQYMDNRKNMSNRHRTTKTRYWIQKRYEDGERHRRPLVVQSPKSHTNRSETTLVREDGKIRLSVGMPDGPAKTDASTVDTYSIASFSPTPDMQIAAEEGHRWASTVADEPVLYPRGFVRPEPWLAPPTEEQTIETETHQTLSSQTLAELVSQSREEEFRSRPLSLATRACPLAATPLLIFSACLQVPTRNRV